MGTAEVGNDESDAALGLNTLVSKTTNASQSGPASYVNPAQPVSNVQNTSGNSQQEQVTSMIDTTGRGTSGLRAARDAHAYGDLQVNDDKIFFTRTAPQQLTNSQIMQRESTKRTKDQLQEAMQARRDRK